MHQRIDSALARNRRAETIVITMAACTFLLGLGVLVAGYWLTNLYLLSAAALCQWLLNRPIREIIQLRRENVILATVPAIVAAMPTKDAVAELRKCLAFLRGARA